MSRIAVMTDSNAGISQEEAGRLGICVLPMPFTIDGRDYFEDINLTQEQFYEFLRKDVSISTSQPSPGSLMDLWKKLLEDHDQLVYIPMSSGLSTSCQTAAMLAQDDPFEGRVFVVDNQRISVTQRQSVLEALDMVRSGYSGEEIRKKLEATKKESSIYITMDTLKYLKRGGRITPAAAAVGTLLRIKPVLQIQGEKLDSFAKARTYRIAKNIMIEAVRRDIETRFGGSADPDNVVICMAYTEDLEAAEEFREEVKSLFPGHEIYMQPLSLSISCHIGPGALALTVSRKQHF